MDQSQSQNLQIFLVTPSSVEASVSHFIDEKRQSIKEKMTAAYNLIETDPASCGTALIEAHNESMALADFTEHLAAINRQTNKLLQDAKELLQEAMQHAEVLEGEVDKLYTTLEDRAQAIGEELVADAVRHLIDNPDRMEETTVEYLAQEILDRSFEDVSDERIAIIRRQLKRARELAERKAEYGDESMPYVPDEALIDYD